jgi:hypothetical protein
MTHFESTLITGVVATALMDLWGVARKPLFGIASPDYGLVGRWFGHMANGRFRHASIAAASPVSRESLIGWIGHYLTGIAFAALLPAVWGVQWLHQPTLCAALTIGIGTAAAPFLLMQPGMGAGIAASRTARPAAARIQTLITHTVFGVGLFAGGQAAAWLDA